MTMTKIFSWKKNGRDCVMSRPWSREKPTPKVGDMQRFTNIDLIIVGFVCFLEIMNTKVLLNNIHL